MNWSRWFIACNTHVHNRHCLSTTYVLRIEILDWNLNFFVFFFDWQRECVERSPTTFPSTREWQNCANSKGGAQVANPCSYTTTVNNMGVYLNFFNYFDIFNERTNSDWLLFPFLLEVVILAARTLGEFFLRIVFINQPVLASACLLASLLHMPRSISILQINSIKKLG